MIEFLPDTYKVEIISHADRYTEGLLLKSAFACTPCTRLNGIPIFPQQHLLDTCVKESDNDHNCPDYHVSHRDAAQSRITAAAFSQVLVRFVCFV